ncbi:MULTISPECIES: YpoC family protein [Staphylococcus]|uniref:YpoC-like domain-containing protein n=1 Tax=Staphylococcus hsinchuensis TaxID=3051183 RepID=A0ABZ3EBF6_9STAP|nr:MULTISPECIES: hypothetical protein [unclassified Staphylococcus]
MTDKDRFTQLEEQLDKFAQAKKLKTPEAKDLLDQYFDLIINYFKEINDVASIDFDQMEDYPVVPMNFEERYHYMIERKYHFMGYRQMKTLKTELVKMNASYKIRSKNKHS